MNVCEHCDHRVNHCKHGSQWINYSRHEWAEWKRWFNCWFFEWTVENRGGHSMNHSKQTEWTSQNMAVVEWTVPNTCMAVIKWTIPNMAVMKLTIPNMSIIEWTIPNVFVMEWTISHTAVRINYSKNVRHWMNNYNTAVIEWTIYSVTVCSVIPVRLPSDPHIPLRLQC